MTVYELRNDVEGYQWLTFPKEADFTVTEKFTGTSLRAGWERLRVAVIEDDLSFEALPSDFPSLGTIPVFSERALEALTDLLRDNGEVLPLTSDHGSYYAFNVTTVIDAIDEHRSTVQRFRDGAIMEILEYEFVSERVQDRTIFKVPQLLSDVFVTDIFVQEVRRAGLVGFAFNEVWSASAPHYRDV